MQLLVVPLAFIDVQCEWRGILWLRSYRELPKRGCNCHNSFLRSSWCRKNYSQLITVWICERTPNHCLIIDWLNPCPNEAIKESVYGRLGSSCSHLIHLVHNSCDFQGYNPLLQEFAIIMCTHWPLHIYLRGGGFAVKGRVVLVVRNSGRCNIKMLTNWNFNGGPWL